MIIGFIRPGLYLPGMAILWSGVSAAIAGVKSYEGLLVVRFFLGVVEAPLFPGVCYAILPNPKDNFVRRQKDRTLLTAEQT